jgi:hypothetical protein
LQISRVSTFELTQWAQEDICSSKASRQILAKAAVKVSGIEVLASRLDINARALKLYLEGNEQIPDSLLLRAIDVIIEGLPQPPPNGQDPSHPES